MNSEDTFEDIIRDTGGFGFFQKRLLFIVLNMYYFTLPASWLNEIFILKTPEHWCWHPSAQGLNDTELLAWKNCYIPKMEDGKEFDGCQIYKPMEMDSKAFWKDKTHFLPGKCPIQEGHTEKVTCQLEHSFDTSDFINTVPMEFNWICDKEGNVPLVLLSGVVGSIVGTSFYNYLGDVIGRKRMTAISVINALVFSLLKTLSGKYLYLYMIFKALASAGYSSSYQLPFAIIMEISTPKTRSYGIASTSVAWSLGICFLPLYAWLLHGDWFILSITSPIPLIFIFLVWNWMPESPRWLLTKKGDVKYAQDILQKIAKVNGVPISEVDSKAFEERLQVFSDKNKENIHNFVKEYKNIVLTPGLRQKTFCLTMASIANFYIYYQIMINVQFNQINTFFMFFLLSVVEGPGYLLGQLLLEIFGRRWTHVGFQITNVLVMIGIVIAQHTMEDFSIVVSALCVLSKLTSCAGYIVFEIQSTELYPTTLRTTGIGFTCLMALIVGLTGPHVVYLGGSVPYVIMGGLCFLAAIASSFLPETKGMDLPENLEQASKFGKKDISLK